MTASVPLSFSTADSTGTHSLYTTFKDYELMFHVSTLLPYTPNNKQQVGMESSTRKASAERRTTCVETEICVTSTLNVCRLPVI